MNGSKTIEMNFGEEYPLRVATKSTSKGSWYWDITARGDDVDEIAERIKKQHEKMLEEFPDNVFNKSEDTEGK